MQGQSSQKENARFACKPMRRCVRFGSLLLSVLILLMWGATIFGWCEYCHYNWCRCGEGRIEFVAFDGNPRGLDTARKEVARRGFTPTPRWQFGFKDSLSMADLGFVLPSARDLKPNPVQSWCIIVPLWLPSGIVWVPTLFIWLHHRRMVHRARGGFCLGCGYDLTGNVSGVCPECGTPVQGQTG